MIIDTRGMDINDIKHLLIENGEVVDMEENVTLLRDYCMLLGICFEANMGNERAKKYLDAEVMKKFTEFIPNNYHEVVISDSKTFLTNTSKEIESKNKEKVDTLASIESELHKESGQEVTEVNTTVEKLSKLSDLEKDYESLLLWYADHLALNALAKDGHIFANRYLSENAINDFSGFVPDENKVSILERVKGNLDNIYKDEQENESNKY